MSESQCCHVRAQALVPRTVSLRDLPGWQLTQFSRRLLTSISLPASLLLTSSAVSVQSGIAKAIDLSIGVGQMQSSTPHIGGGIAPTLDLMVSRWREGTSRKNLVFGLGVGIQGGGTYDLVCRLTASGDCMPPYPGFTSLSALAGWQSPRGWLRVFGGPTLAYGDEAALGLQGRIDLAAPLSRRVSLTLNGRGFALPSFQGASYQLFDVGFGLRIVER